MIVVQPRLCNRTFAECQERGGEGKGGEEKEDDHAH